MARDPGGLCQLPAATCESLEVCPSLAGSQNQRHLDDTSVAAGPDPEQATRLRDIQNPDPQTL